MFSSTIIILATIFRSIIYSFIYVAQKVWMEIIYSD